MGIRYVVFGYPILGIELQDKQKPSGALFMVMDCCVTLQVIVGSKWEAIGWGFCFGKFAS